MNNLPVKFLVVTIQNFRGIPDELVVPLDAPLTVIHAANGTGKSTICYALEWLITGKVADLNGVDLECQWGKGVTLVSAKCLIDNKPNVLTRTKSSLWMAEGGGSKKKISDDFLLEMLTPTTISGKSTIALRRAKRGWLRNSRWLYSNSLALLIDNNKAEERQQIFADILGFGHLTSTLRDLRDYKKALPNTRGLSEKVTRLNTEIEILKKSIAINSPAKNIALINLETIFKALPPVVEGSISEQLEAAQLRVKVLNRKQHREMSTLKTLHEQWPQYHNSLQQIQSLRQSVDAATQQQKQASEDQVLRASELSEAQQKLSDAERSIKWANESLLILYDWQSVSTAPGVEEYFQNTNTSQLELTANFAELNWDSDHQEQWKEAIFLLSTNFQRIMELDRQKNDLTAFPVAPATNYDEKVRLSDAAKNMRIRAEADFDALSNILGKLRAIGSEIAHSHDDTHCPLCNYDWLTTHKLRQEISSNTEALAPGLDAVADALTQARQKEQEAINTLALATSQKSAHDSYLSRYDSINQELQSFAKRTKYFQIMGVQDFSGMSLAGLANLKSRINSAINTRRILTKLAEIEKFFGNTPVNSASARVSNAAEHLERYKKHFQDQFNQYEPLRARLNIVAHGLLQTIQSKASEIAAVNTSIAAATAITSSFESYWRELFGNQPVLIESYELMRRQLEQRENEIIHHSKMLDECEAVVSADTDSIKLRTLEQELTDLTSKLKIGIDYITKADQAIEQYSLHVKQFTASSLKPLLSPAAELFSRMHANEVYKGLGVSGGEDALKWTVFAEGHESALDAEGKLSQGQRQDLALSLYLARARNTGGSFFLDEPIAHLDDLNRVAMLDIFRLAATSMPSMNLILTTASDSLARHMAQKFSSITDRHLLNMIHLEGNPRNGVKMAIHRNVALSSHPK
ncbi:hypothetical protein thsps117_43090 [Pseudomonas sp. No.117]